MASLANRVDGTVYAPGKTFPWVTRVAVVEAVLRHNNALRLLAVNNEDGASGTATCSC